MVAKKPSLEEVMSDLADLAMSRYTPPEGSFSSGEYLKTLVQKMPTANEGTARRHLNALVAAGKLRKTEDKFLAEEGGALAYYYIPIE